MKSSFLMVGALALVLSCGVVVLPGCGGGGSGGGSSPSAPSLRFNRTKNVQFIDFPEYRGILTINFADQQALPTRASGTLQVVNVANSQPSTEPRPSFSVGLPAATYIVVGNVTQGTNGFDYDLDLSGSYQDGPKFRLTGNFDDQGLISINAPFEMGNSILRGRVLPFTGATTGTTNGTTTGTTNGTTTGTTTAGTTTGTTVGTTTGTTTGGTTTGGLTTGGLTTGGLTTGGLTTGGLTTGGLTTGGLTGGTTAGATTAGSTLSGNGGGTTNPPALP